MGRPKNDKHSYFYGYNKLKYQELNELEFQLW